jgi:hypothetical protein
VRFTATGTPQTSQCGEASAWHGWRSALLTAASARSR